MALEHPQVRMPPPLIHLGGLLVGYGLDQVSGWRFAPVPWLDGLALGLALVGLLLSAWTLATLHRYRTTVLPHRAAATLVTTGPFRWSRNPIYLAFTLLHLACGLALGSPGMLLMLVPVFYVMDRHVIAAEEAFHEQAFATQWQQYRERVRRWL
jgi:protein-S-isoprenylcysteine O-methyltransferase Ste14